MARERMRFPKEERPSLQRAPSPRRHERETGGHADTQPRGALQAMVQLQQSAGNQAVQRSVAAVQRALRGAQESATLQHTLIQNPDAVSETEKACRVIMQTALVPLLKNTAIHEQGEEPPTDLALKARVSQYAKLRLHREPSVFEFRDERHRITLGEQSPETLAEKVEDHLVDQVEAVPGWHLLGLSIMDAEHSALLAVDNRNPGARRIYWMDQVEGGYRDVTGRLDAKIEETTRDFWQAQPADRKRRTRVCFWRFVPA